MKDITDIKSKEGESINNLVRKLEKCGFQGTNLFQAVETIKKMKSEGTIIFLAFTANMMASGLRGILTDLVEKGYVDAVITTGGSIDHDIIRSYKTYKLGKFNEDDVQLHKKGINRIGNIQIPNSRYMFLEKKMKTYYKLMQKQKNVFTPTELNKLIGENLPTGSFLRACSDKKIPVFSPGMVDSAVGMHLFFFRQDNKQFIMDTAEDLQQLADIIFTAKKTSGIILGGGISKHHVIGANLLRGGLDYAVYITTAQEYDGSLSGAAPKEAKSWGKIREKGSTVTVYGDATLILPIINSCI